MTVAVSRPARPLRAFLGAGAIGVLLLVAMAVTSVANVRSHGAPQWTGWFGLVAGGLALAGGVYGLRAVREPNRRSSHLRRALLLFGLGLLGWLVVMDVFTYLLLAGPEVALVAALACAPTTGLAVLAVRWLDRYDSQPWPYLLAALVWGALAATLLVSLSETLWQMANYDLVPGQPLELSIAFMAGSNEEVAKGVAVFLLYLVLRERFQGVVAGIVYGAAVGIGFNFLETMTYIAHLYYLFSGLVPDPKAGPAWVGPLAAGVAQWFIRQVLGMFLGHPTYTALIGAGIGAAAVLPKRHQRFLSILGGLLLAVAAHFSWDAWASLFPTSSSNALLLLISIPARNVLMTGPFTVVVLLVLVMGLEVEGAGLRRQLEQEVAAASGAVGAGEVPVLLSAWRRLDSRYAAFALGGWRTYRRLTRLQTAQLRLARLKWQREQQGKPSDPDSEAAGRSQILELREALAV
ncbi:MAG: PrsW family intramembrane metalloprotease [Candidatus Dormibacteraeota bacterium]|nr:PrsW family intramembrane metalloprotease [Candidatus Dormibacteraeota bacterium]